MTSECCGEETCTPRWATEVRRPDPHTIEFWRPIATVFSTDYNETADVALIQNGPDAPPQILICGLRFTVNEAIDVFEAARIAIGLLPRPAGISGAR